MNNFLLTAMRDMLTGLDLVHFQPVAGCQDRSDRKTECAVIHDVEIRSHDGEAKPKMHVELTKLCARVEEAQSEKGQHGEMFLFVGLISLDDEIGARIFARCLSREGWEAWQRDTLVRRFWETVKINVASMRTRP